MRVCRALAIVMIMLMFPVGVVLMPMFAMRMVCMRVAVFMTMFMAVRVIVVMIMSVIMLSFYSAFTFTATAYCTHRAPLKISLSL